MRRLFWLAMGITIGALVVRKLSRAAEKMTPAISEQPPHVPIHTPLGVPIVQ